MRLSASRLRSYKSCKRKYELEYIELLKPLQKAEALETGSDYHKKLQELIDTGTFEQTGDKTDAMAKAFQKYVLPNLPKLIATEQKFEFGLNGHTISGIIDAITELGIPVEHKSSGVALDEKYINRLNWDDQVPIYLIASGQTKCYYTVCQKPTIRQKQNETFEDYLKRCEEWYDEGTETKIGIFVVNRTQQELDDKKKELEIMCNEIENTKYFYKNPSNCSMVECQYSSVCLNYDPSIEPIGFTKGGD